MLAAPAAALDKPQCARSPPSLVYFPPSKELPFAKTQSRVDLAENGL